MSLATMAYLCHECGHRLVAVLGRYPLYCERCDKYRKVPTHPALRFYAPTAITRSDGAPR